MTTQDTQDVLFCIVWGIGLVACAIALFCACWVMRLLGEIDRLEETLRHKCDEVKQSEIRWRALQNLRKLLEQIVVATQKKDE